MSRRKVVAPMLELESTLVVVVPEAEALVGSFRDLYDPVAAAGVPAHITVLYPFKSPDEVNETVMGDLRRCFSRVEPFDFVLSTIHRFSSEVLYLAPEPAEPFRQLTLSAWNLSPETPPYGGRYPSVVPHLTVADHQRDALLDEIAHEFKKAAEGKLPIHARAKEVALLDTRSGRWEIRTVFGLGSGLS